MFWVIMTLVAVTICLVYAVIGMYGTRWWGMTPERTRKFRNSSWLALGWTAVCLAHFALQH